MQSEIVIYVCCFLEIGIHVFVRLMHTLLDEKCSYEKEKNKERKRMG